ncbi:MAG: DUF3109 family protein [Prevotella sp.]|nr:DUF3109 family protein [Prevotella sp.]
MILDIDGILVSSDILTEYFCCNLAQCKGRCCIEGDAGAPVTLDEIGEIEQSLDLVWPHLSAQAQAVVDKQGVAYTDKEGDLVTSIVNGKDCVFTCYDNIEIDGKTVENCCLCAYERIYRQGKSQWCKPASCALYPIRMKELSSEITALNYHRWDICRDAVEEGRKKGIKVYQFLREPLTRRFGEDWYKELETVADEMEKISK